MVCFYVHLYCTLKQATNFVKGDIDQELFRGKMTATDLAFKSVYSKLVDLFAHSVKTSESFRNSKVELSEMVLFYVDGLELFKNKSFVFDISDYLNFETQIYGLKLPESYEGVLKNINEWKKQTGEGREEEYLDYSDFKAKQK